MKKNLQNVQAFSQQFSIFIDVIKDERKKKQQRENFTATMCEFFDICAHIAYCILHWCIRTDEPVHRIVIWNMFIHPNQKQTATADVLSENLFEACFKRIMRTFSMEIMNVS